MFIKTAIYYLLYYYYVLLRLQFIGTLKICSSENSVVLIFVVHLQSPVSLTLQIKQAIAKYSENVIKIRRTTKTKTRKNKV